MLGGGERTGDHRPSACGIDVEPSGKSGGKGAAECVAGTGGINSSHRKCGQRSRAVRIANAYPSSPLGDDDRADARRVERVDAAEQVDFVFIWNDDIAESEERRAEFCGRGWVQHRQRAGRACGSEGRCHDVQWHFKLDEHDGGVDRLGSGAVLIRTGDDHNRVLGMVVDDDHRSTGRSGIGWRDVIDVDAVVRSNLSKAVTCVVMANGSDESGPCPRTCSGDGLIETLAAGVFLVAMAEHRFAWRWVPRRACDEVKIGAADNENVSQLAISVHQWFSPTGGRGRRLAR